MGAQFHKCMNHICVKLRLNFSQRETKMNIIVANPIRSSDSILMQAIYASLTARIIYIIQFCGYKEINCFSLH